MRKRLIKGLATTAILGTLLATAACSAEETEAPRGETTPEQVDASAERLAVAMTDVVDWTGPTESFTPPSDVNLTIITCMSALYGCLAPAQAAQEAAEKLGWTVTINDGQGDPAVQNRLVEQAVAGGTDAILTTAVDAAFIRSGLAAAKEAGVRVVSANQGTAPSEDGFDVDVTTDYAAMGSAEADWMIADSDGTATVLPLIDREYEDIIDYAEATVDTLEAECPGCTILPFEEFLGADVGNGLGARVVQLLQRNPDIDYILGNYDPACADIVAAVRSADLSDGVKMACTLGDPQNLEFIRDGEVEHAVVAIDLVYNGYAVVDQLGRLLADVPLATRADTTDPKLMYNENAPFRIITPENIGELPDGTPWAASVDYVAEYETLWGLR
ncbi:substrate-binding domain-containing protein [Microbacterium aquimaris]|uniref:sugar ABC transporter substrate-binding protein n=1 Tax=Microbacterium aquimaris TaxID=459816 RepID=UPI002AD28617|nr:substrate-binding domain-containing protein [Microbacterium aquimaris]MDZ8274833.1 substrate-binding domain-containing protein [Microbacterium aquimaris]